MTATSSPRPPAPARQAVAPRADEMLQIHCACCRYCRQGLWCSTEGDLKQRADLAERRAAREAVAL